VNELYEVKLNRGIRAKSPKNLKHKSSQVQRKSVYKVNEEEPSSSNRPLFHGNSKLQNSSDRFDNSRSTMNQKSPDPKEELTQQKHQEAGNIKFKSGDSIVSMMDNSRISEEPKAKIPQRDVNSKKQIHADNFSQLHRTNQLKEKIPEQILNRQKTTGNLQSDKRVDRGEGLLVKFLDQLNHVERNRENSVSESLEESKTARNLSNLILENYSSEPPQTNPVKNVEVEGLKKPFDQKIEIVIEDNQNILENKEFSDSVIERHSDKINVSFSKFLWSFVKQQPEMEIINKAEKEITDSMDIAALAKKCSDLDKLKMILLTPQERAIFDNLPVSVLSVKSEKDSSKIAVNYYKWVKSEKGKKQKVDDAYVFLKKNAKKTELQRKLLGLYENQYLQDFDLSELQNKKGIHEQ